MTTVQEIEQAIRSLSPEEFTEFRLWFAELDAQIWDRELENDVASGRLEALAQKALDDLRQGRCAQP